MRAVVLLVTQLLETIFEFLKDDNGAILLDDNNARLWAD